MSGPLEKANTSFLIACGGRDGTVGLWKWHLDDSTKKPIWEEVFKQKIHEGGVNALCFVGERILLSGGVNRKIYSIKISDSHTIPELEKTFELKLQCKRMKIQGLVGKRERESLEMAGAIT